MTGTHDATVARLWEELSGTLRTWFLRRCGDAEAAEDLLQETFLRVHTGLATVRDEERLAGWVHRIAQNLLIDFLRGRRVAVEPWAEEALEPEPPGESTGAPGESTEAPGESTEAPGESTEAPGESTEAPGESTEAVVASWLAPAIEGLDEGQREVLRLTELEGLGQRAAAERLGLSLSALKSRVLRGRARLRERVFACCELEFDRRGGIIAYRRRSADCCDS